jgi:hypothetical protein
MVLICRFFGSFYSSPLPTSTVKGSFRTCSAPTWAGLESNVFSYRQFKCISCSTIEIGRIEGHRFESLIDDRASVKAAASVARLAKTQNPFHSFIFKE